MERCLNCMKEYDDEYDVCPHCGHINDTVPEDSFQLYPGVKLQERYIIGTVIDTGGFGIIYRAWDTKLNLMVAIKEYYPAGLVSRTPGTEEVIPVANSNKRRVFKEGIGRFLGEARAMARFSDNENIVHVFDFFEANNTAYLVMEYLDGLNLKGYLESNKTISVEEAVDIILKISNPLECMHKRNIVHRDINLRNIMICKNGDVKMIDFGAARAPSGELSKSVSVILTPGYAPPEQYDSNGGQGPWTDIYALSATLYHMVTGIKPEESIDRVKNDILEFPTNINKDIPEWLSNTIMTGMALDYNLRFKSVAEMRKCLIQEKKALIPEKRVERKKKTRLLFVATAVLLFIGAFSLSMLYLADYHGWFVENGTITMWLPNDEFDDSIYDMVAKYKKQYDGKKIEITLIDANDYSNQINQAAGNGNLPDIFLKDALEEKYYNQLADISDYLNAKSHSEYHLINQYKADLAKEKIIPLGFNVLVLYENTVASASIDNPYSIDECMDLSSISPESNAKHTIYDSSYGLTQKIIIPLTNNQGKEKALDIFTNSETQDIPYYIGMTNERRTVQNALAGYNKIYGVSNKDVMYAEFADELCINTISFENHEKLILLWLDYLLGENGQNSLYLQNDRALPINSKSYSKYITNIKSLSFLKDKYNCFEAAR